MKKFSIPRWIKEDKLLFSRFVNRLFSCEGCVDLYSKCIEIKMYKEINLTKEGIMFFNDIKKHLDKYFDIKTTNPFLEGKATERKKGYKSVGIRLKIKNKESLINFNKFIGFENKDKKEKLNKILNSY